MALAGVASLPVGCLTGRRAQARKFDGHTRPGVQENARSVPPYCR